MSIFDANSAPGRVARETEQKAKDTARHPVIQALGRLGYVARGLVYIIIGGLAAFAALGQGGGTTDRKGAIVTIYEQPFGKFLLALVTFGLLCYAAWNFIKAIADTEGKGQDAKGIATRLVYVGVGISYASLAFAAFQLVTGSGNGGNSSDGNAQDWTAKLLQNGFGVFLVIAAGLVVLGVAAFQFYKAYKANFEKTLDLSRMSAKTADATRMFGRFGYAARGVVFGEIGIFLIIAALNHNPGQARGLGGALQELAKQPYGQVLLGVVALGLVAFGIFSIIEARYRRMVRGYSSRRRR